MPTSTKQTTQKRQELFQPVLSDIGTSVGDTGRTIPGPGLSAATAAVEGAANILGTLANKPLDPVSDSSELVANKADLEALLAGELSLVAGQSISGGIIPGSKQEIAKVSAAFQQGRISRNEMNVRLASVVQQFVAGDPRNAEEYRDIAREALGFQPSAQIAADRLNDIQFDTDQQRQITRDNADYAIQQYGFVIKDNAGGIDVEATAEKGLLLRQQDGEMRRLKDKAELLKTRAETSKARKLTSSERTRLDFKVLNEGTRHVLDGHLEAAYAAADALHSGALGTIEDTDKRAAITNELQQRRNAIIQTINRAALDGNIDNKAKEDLLNNYLSVYDATISLISGDSSEFATNKAMLDAANVTDATELKAIAPNISRLNAVLGPQATASIINTSLASNPSLRSSVNRSIFEETEAFLTGVSETLVDGKEIKDQASEQRPATAKGLLTIIDSVNKKPQRASEAEKQSYFISNAKLINAALEVSSVQDRANAASRLSSQANLSALDMLRANDQNAETVGEQLRNLNTQAFIESVRRTTPDTTARQVLSSVATRGQKAPLVFTPTYNPVTNTIDIETQGRVATEALPGFMKAQVKLMNQNLDAIVRLKDFGNDELNKYTDEQIKLAFSQLAGIAITDQENLPPLPGGLTSFLGLPTPALSKQAQQQLRE